MTGMTGSSAGLTARQRKALYRAWHRGTREADLILGSFADIEIACLDDAELDSFEALLDQPDSQILKWMTGEAEVPTAMNTEIFRRIRSHAAGGEC